MIPQSRKFDDADVEVRLDGLVLSLIFSGDLHPDDRFQLIDFLDAVVSSAREGQLRVLADFRGIRLVNSTSIHTLIQFMRKLSEDKIHSEFLYDASQRARSVAFQALEFTARDSEYISVRGVPA